jgi:hypothetical protein
LRHAVPYRRDSQRTLSATAFRSSSALPDPEGTPVCTPCRVVLSQTHQKQGPFPPPALPGFLGTSGPFRRPDGPPPLLRRLRFAIPATIPDLPY